MNKTERSLINQDQFTLGDRMKLARIGSGLNVEETAALMKIKPVTLYGKENGQELITPRNIAKFEDAVGIQPGTLIENACDLDQKEISEFHAVVYRNKIHAGRKKGESAGKYIERIIRHRIAVGKYAAVIPPQKELVEEFGYSRLTIDSALKPLRKEGIIKGRTKSGTFIVNSPDL